MDKNLSQHQKILLVAIILFLLSGLGLAFYLAQQAVRPTPKAQVQNQLSFDFVPVPADFNPGVNNPFSVQIWATAPVAANIQSIKLFLQYNSAVVDLIQPSADPGINNLPTGPVTVPTEGVFSQWSYTQNSVNPSRADILQVVTSNRTGGGELIAGQRALFGTLNFVWKTDQSPDAQNPLLVVRVVDSSAAEETGFPPSQALDAAGNPVTAAGGQLDFPVPPGEELPTTQPPTATPATQLPTATPPPAGATLPGTTIGVVRWDEAQAAQLWHLKFALSGGNADYVFPFGSNAQDTPVVGDWDGDGEATVGVFRNGVWSLLNANRSSEPDLNFSFGEQGDIPVAGHWFGNPGATETVGVFRNGVWSLRNANGEGNADLMVNFGQPGDLPVVGDWDGDGIDSYGLVRTSNGTLNWYLTNVTHAGLEPLTIDPATTVQINFGAPGAIPVVGDWDGDGIDTIGVVGAARDWHLTNLTIAEIAADPSLIDPSRQGYAERVFTIYYGVPGDIPVVGKWARPESAGEPTATPPAGTTETPAPAGPQAGTLSLQFVFQGVTPETVYRDATTKARGSTQPVQVKIVHPVKEISAKFKDIEATVSANPDGTLATNPDGDVIYTASFEPVGVPVGNGYLIFIKGPRHLQRMFCNDGQNKPCRGRLASSINLTAANNNFDFSQLALEAGDLPLPQIGQDGVVDSQDWVYLRNLVVVKSKNQVGQDLSVGDLDLGGSVDSRDQGLMAKTLWAKYEEDE